MEGISKSSFGSTGDHNGYPHCDKTGYPIHIQPEHTQSNQMDKK